MAHSLPRQFLCALELIDVAEQQLRHDPEDDSIIELAQDIAQKGLIQPVGVSAKQDGRYQLRWGGRRLAAHKRLSKPTIWARLWERDDVSVKALAAAENLQRKQMTLAEEVDAAIYMHEIDHRSVEQISAAIGKGRSWVQNRLMVPSLPDFLRDPLLAGDLRISHLEVLARVPEDGAKRYLTGMCIQNRWNTSQLKTIADCYMNPQQLQEPQANSTPGVRPNTANAPFFYTCEACGEKGQLHEFTLVRVHKDGCRSDALTNRSADASSRGDGMEGRKNRHIRS